MSKALVAAALLGLCLGVASAQVAKPGDYLIASYLSPADAVYAVTPGTNTYRTVLTVPTASKIRGVTGGPLNTDYYVASALNVFRVTPTGAVTTIATLAPGVGTAWADLDEDGNILVGTGWGGSGALFSVDYRTGAWTTISPTGIFPNAFVLDRDTGDIVYGDNTNSTIYRRKRDGTIVKLFTIPGTNYAMDFHPQTGEVLIGSNSAIFKIDALNTLGTWAAGTGLVKSLAVQADGNVAAGPHGTVINLYDSNGIKIGTPYNGPSITKLDMVIEDEHNVWGANAMVVGGNFSISIRFASFSGKPYLMAASLSRAPGIPIDSRVVPLTPDALFAASLVLPTIFQNFAGVLDPCGRASAILAVPKIPALRGLRVFLAAVVIDGAAPSGIGQISQAYGATVQ